jgi:hypothetical protein
LLDSVALYGVHRVLAYHAWFDGSAPSQVAGSEGAVAADRVATVGAADEHAESVIAIISAGIVVLAWFLSLFIIFFPFTEVLREFRRDVTR